MKKYLHIISFDIPYPANYGGAIDVYYKLKALHETGLGIILHCFEYNRKQASELAEICEKVYYYKRNTSIIAQLSILPYTVYSRKIPELLENLLKDDYPILFEGLMCCYYLDNPLLSNRKKLFRPSNIEQDYYNELAGATGNLTKKMYFKLEAFRFRLFERKLKAAAVILTVSKSDGDQLKLRFPEKRIEFIPCFHANNTVKSLPGKSNFILYHGNLSVAENEIAAIYLCKNVFSKLNYKCKIAGLNPTKKLEKIVSVYANIELIPNPDDNEMATLIQDAQVHLLVTFQGTGLKLKLLNTLFAGRHLLVNKTMLEGTGLDKLCTIADTSNKLINECKRLMQTPFSQAHISDRQNSLFPQFSNSSQATRIAEML